MKGIIQENAVFKNIVDERGPHSDDDCRNKQKLWPISLKIEEKIDLEAERQAKICLLYTSPSPRDRQKSRMPSSA